MSDEKTMDELKAELEAAKKVNLERELSIEQAKIDEAEKLAKKKDEETLREEIKAEVLKEMKGTSTIVSDDAEQLSQPKKGSWEKFSQTYVKKHNLSGKTYEDIIEELAGGGY